MKNYAKQLFEQLTKNHENWNKFAQIYNHNVTDYVNDMPKDSSYDVESISKQLTELLDNWDSDWIYIDAADTITDIVNDWRDLTDDEQANWFCGDGIYGFIEQETEKYGIELDEYQYTELASKLIGEDQYHKDCIERIKHEPASLLIAKNIATKLTTEPETWEQLVKNFDHDVVAFCQQFIDSNELVNVDEDAIVEYVYDFLDKWDKQWFIRLRL